MSPTCIALVPARSGSKRVKHKNIRPLAGVPLMAYTISAALASGVFADVVVSTDSSEYAEIARSHGAWVPFLAGLDGSCHTDTSPDIAWVSFTLRRLREMGREYDAFSILRPTNPFRGAETIRRAWARWKEKGAAFDSMRAVEKCGQHPYKMWLPCEGSSGMLPLAREYSMAGFWKGDTPAHSRQYADLPTILVQNASLEIAWTRTALEQGSIAGGAVLPFHTEGHEGFDVNTELDLLLAELLVQRGLAALPPVLMHGT